MSLGLTSTVNAWPDAFSIHRNIQHSGACFFYRSMNFLQSCCWELVFKVPSLICLSKSVKSLVLESFQAIHKANTKYIVTFSSDIMSLFYLLNHRSTKVIPVFFWKGSIDLLFLLKVRLILLGLGVLNFLRFFFFFFLAYMQTNLIHLLKSVLSN